jgi:transcriptional regulator with XRE-family HTH domain
MKQDNEKMKPTEMEMNATPLAAPWNPQASERWKRLYAARGGPLMGWLDEEAKARGLQDEELARELCVTTGYLAQLRNGVRDASNVTHDFAAAAAMFLEVPTVAVLVVAGQLRLVDFVRASHFDRWVESTVDAAGAEPVHLACGAVVGPEELRLLPLMVDALHRAAGIHERRRRVS